MIIHEEPAEYASWLKLIFVIPIGLIVGGLVSLYLTDIELSLSLIGEGALLLLLFYFIMPRRFQIYDKRLTIVLGPPLTISIWYSTIDHVRRGSGISSYAYSGIRFATSAKYVIEIVRKKGFNYVISPQNGDVFLEQLRHAIETSRHLV